MIYQAKNCTSTLFCLTKKNSCSNKTNRIGKFPVSCTLLQLLLSTAFVHYIFFGGGLWVIFLCFFSRDTHILCLNLVSGWNKDQYVCVCVCVCVCVYIYIYIYIHDRLHYCIKCKILSLHNLQACFRCLCVMKGHSNLAEVLIAIQKLLLGFPCPSCQVFRDTFCLNSGLQEEYNTSMFKIHTFT